MKFQDLTEIIKFINPKAWNLSIVDPIYSKRIAKIVHNVKHYKHWVVSRHKFYYEWIFFGWKLLPSDYTFHRPVNSTEYPDHISNWVHKRFSHKNYLNQELFYRDDDRDFVPLKLCKIINPNQPESHYFSNDDPPYTTYNFVNEDGVRIQAIHDTNEGM